MIFNERLDSRIRRNDEN